MKPPKPEREKDACALTPSFLDKGRLVVAVVKDRIEVTVAKGRLEVDLRIKGGIALTGLEEALHTAGMTLRGRAALLSRAVYWTVHIPLSVTSCTTAELELCCTRVLSDDA